VVAASRQHAAPAQPGGDKAQVRKVSAATAWRIVAAVFFLMTAASCASTEGVLVPVSAPSPGTDRVNLLAATTRERTGDPGVIFSGERGDTLSFENIIVSIPSNREVGSIQWPRPGAADPARDFAVISTKELTRADVPKWFNGSAGKKKRVLIFVHGYNSRFESAVFHFAQLVHDMNADAEPVLFSWPSRGRLLDYNYDRESATFSRGDLAYVLRAAARSPNVDDVVVLAHSMGAWVTMEAIRLIALQDGRVPAKISNVILASPDLDVDVFRRQVMEIGYDRPRITIFISRHDRALHVSSLLAGQVARVGALDLTQAENVARLESSMPGIVVLDLSALQSGDALKHSKFATSPAVVQLLGERLISGQEIQDPEVGAVVAAHTLGDVVGNVAAAPIVLFMGGLRK
jgi:esterase/lipase superfamily enzyme